MLGNIFIENDLYLYQENSISSNYQQQSTSTMQSSGIRVNQQRQVTNEDFIIRRCQVTLDLMISDLQNFNDKMLDDERQIQDHRSLTKWKAYQQRHNIKKKMFNQQLSVCQKELSNSLSGQNPILLKIKQSTQKKISRKINSITKSNLKSKVQLKKGGKKFREDNAQINQKQKNPRSLQSVSKSKKKIGQQDQKRKNVSSLSLLKKKNDQGHKNLKIQVSKKKIKNNQDKNSKLAPCLSQPKKKDFKKQQSKKNISVGKPKRKIGVANHQLSKGKIHQNSNRTFVTDPNFQFYQNKKKINVRHVTNNK